ncbi:esterase-like activity of phytase family protein [Mesorhizobium sp. CAU 1741]|uniref:esterase-like activity of phytase family protein n=1 Tax=Mesorhizobium sp. CAU 1741 TaxID=3140366 RepID=UPI00325ADAD4
MTRRILPLLAAACATFLQNTVLSAQSVAVTSVPISHFRFGSEQTRFGALEFVGGFEMRAGEREFGQLSSIRFLTPGGDFVGVADNGHWFLGAIERDSDEVPVGVRDFRMQAMVGPQGQVIARKADKDAEGLEIFDDIATVSFEREARISEYRLDRDGMADPIRDLDLVVPRNELRHNQGFETLARAPEGGALAGARLIIAERSIDTNGDIFAAILEGPEKGVFKVRRTDDFDVTDGTFLPDGDLLLLERRFSLAQGIAMRLRRIAGANLRQGAVVDGEVLMEADLAYHIDNMEGLDVWRRGDGALIVSLLSDDNQSFLQRTIYLEFVLGE